MQKKGAKTGRPSMFEKKVKSRYKEIEKMLKHGASETQVAQACGVAMRTWDSYKNTYPEFKEFIDNINRFELVMDLRSALVKRALGFEYEEKKQYIKEDNEGNEYKYTEITTKQALPDVAALNLALKNYDKDNWANDPQALRLREQELKLRQEMYEDSKW